MSSGISTDFTNGQTLVTAEWLDHVNKSTFGDLTIIASHATTGAIWASGITWIDWTGTATTIAFPAASQAGDVRILKCAGACSFTAGANMLIRGFASGETFTAAANDRVEVFAVSTTQFLLTPSAYNGSEDTYTSASTACTGALTVSAVWKLTKIGRTVTLTVPSTTQTPAAAVATSFLYGVFVPSKYRPLASIAATVVIRESANNLADAGTLRVASDGSIRVFKSITETANFSTGAGETGLYYGASVSWVI